MTESAAPVMSRSSRVCWFQGTSGIAGDMALGALVDAGADVDEIRSQLDLLDLEGWSLTAEHALRGGIAGTRAVVEVATDGQPARTARAILDRIGSAGLAERAASRAVATFEALAAVEGAIHGVPPTDVHFHEVGALDSIIDTVGVCVALELLGIDHVGATHLTHGHGSVRTEHGLLPNPPPAVVALAVGVPSVGIDVPMEMTTPTGAALLVTLADRWGPLPHLVIETTGYGAGGRDLPDRPNHAQVVIGTLLDTVS